MSITSFSSNHNNKIYKTPSHRRNNSGEIEVFQASKYFSDAITDQNPALNLSNPQNTTPTRMSLDMPVMLNPIIPPEFHHLDQKQPKLENKKYKQPSSPGGLGRLASFLNSLFNQTSLKNKKSKLGKDFDDENTLGSGRRKRRSSHFRIITSSNTVVAAGDNSRSGFRIPQPYADTPTKSMLPAGKGGRFKTTLQDDMGADKKYEKIVENNSKDQDFRKFDDGDYGEDSDSSSDLFDLPNHELDFYSSGLPVYETTHMDTIKLVKPIYRANTV